ncbi:Hsp70 family protein [bacterium]|nr:Hsp70 family protein [bacterium]
MTNQSADKHLASTISIAVFGDSTAALFLEGHAVPVRKHRKVAPSQEDSTSIEIHLVQGKSSLASENISIGKWQLSGFSPGSEEEKRIEEIAFCVDSEGLLTIKSIPHENSLEVRLLTEDIPLVELR